MILSLTIKNFLSYKNAETFSFEATNDKYLEDIHVVEIAPGVRLLKFGVIYGANASGKSNLLEAFDFLRHFVFSIPDSKDDDIGLIPFRLDNYSESEASCFNLIFYVEGKKFDYSLKIKQNIIEEEKLLYYPSIRPKLVFHRTHESISKIEYGAGIKLSVSAKNEISVKCLPNMSVFASYNQVNVEVFEMEKTIKWLQKQFMRVIEPDMDESLHRYVDGLINEDDAVKGEILKFLQEADFNISNIYTEIIKEKIPDLFISAVLEDSSFPSKEKERIKKEKTFEVPKTEFEHEVFDDNGKASYYKLPTRLQSQGTKRTFELSGPIIQAIERGAFLAIDEVESKLHPLLIEYIIQKFLLDSKESQLLVTTHYDGLLDEEDLLRKDNIWFTEKDKSGATKLFSLANFKAVNRISSLLKAYKYGKFGAIPNFDR